jgi:myo-inositol-1(or 4)-monophosphatase
MHHDIDLAHCAQLLKQITDGIAASGPRRAVDAGVPALIAQVHGVSAAADRLLRAELQARYPHIGWRDEDSAAFDAAAPHWVYDPVDGAYHYLQGLPLWAASLALVQDGRAVLALIYDPALDDMFIAAEGAGATLSGQPLRVSPKADLASAVVGSAIAPRLQVGAEAQADALRLLAAIAPQVFVIRPMAATSLQLAYVAAGRLDAYWEAGNDAADWLAGALLVREAGGAVSSLDGGPLREGSRGIVAGNDQLAGQLRMAAAPALPR